MNSVKKEITMRTDICLWMMHELGMYKYESSYFSFEDEERCREFIEKFLKLIGFDSVIWSK